MSDAFPIKITLPAVELSAQFVYECMRKMNTMYMRVIDTPMYYRVTCVEKGEDAPELHAKIDGFDPAPVVFSIDEVAQEIANQLGKHMHEFYLESTNVLVRSAVNNWSMNVSRGLDLFYVTRDLLAKRGIHVTAS